MIDNDVITQAISESIQISIKNCFDVFEPYIIQFLLSALILLFIKSLINKVIDLGYSEKEIKHKKSIASKTVDFLSDLSDIIPKSKDK